MVKLRDVALVDVPRSSRTMVVSVDEVLEKPAAVSLVETGKVSVEAREPLRCRAGGLVAFYRKGWIFGNGGAAREGGHKISPASTAGASSVTRDELAQIRKELSDADCDLASRGPTSW